MFCVTQFTTRVCLPVDGAHATLIDAVILNRRRRRRRRRLGVGDNANFGIDPIPSKYRASITDTDTDTFYLKIPDQ